MKAIKIGILLMSWGALADCDEKYRACEESQAMRELAGIQIDYNMCSDARVRCEEREHSLEEIMAGLGNN